MPDFVMEMISGLRRLMKKHCEDSTSDDRDTTDRGIFFYDIWNLYFCLCILWNLELVWIYKKKWEKLNCVQTIQFIIRTNIFRIETQNI